MNDDLELLVRDAVARHAAAAPDPAHTVAVVLGAGPRVLAEDVLEIADGAVVHDLSAVQPARRGPTRRRSLIAVVAAALVLGALASVIVLRRTADPDTTPAGPPLFAPPPAVVVPIAFGPSWLPTGFREAQRWATVTGQTVSRTWSATGMPDTKPMISLTVFGTDGDTTSYRNLGTLPDNRAVTIAGQAGTLTVAHDPENTVQAVWSAGSARFQVTAQQLTSDVDRTVEQVVRFADSVAPVQGETLAVAAELDPGSGFRPRTHGVRAAVAGADYFVTGDTDGYGFVQVTLSGKGPNQEDRARGREESVLGRQAIYIPVQPGGRDDNLWLWSEQGWLDVALSTDGDSGTQEERLARITRVLASVRIGATPVPWATGP